MAPNTLPAMAKSAGNYMNSQLIKVEAVKSGFVEGIALDSQGYVSEGSGENLFVVSKGRLLTPPLVSSVLPGITRRQRAHAGPPPRDPGRGEGAAARDALPRGRALLHRHRGRDHADPLGGPAHGRRGVAGPRHRGLQKAFFDVIECRASDEHGWLTFVPALTGAVQGGTR